MKKLLLIITLALACIPMRAQFTDCSSGLLQMPTALMQDNGTVMITNNYLNSHSLPLSGWGYDTFSYGFNLTFWSRFEVGYVCTIFDGKRKPNPSDRDKVMFNQDRHFIARFQFLKEGEFGLAWMPALVVGVSDPSTGSGTGGYLNPSSVSGSGNGFFNRMYVVASKHFNTPWGLVCAHGGWQANRRVDYSINGPCVGLDWQIKWLQNLGVVDNIDLIAEYDSRTVNLGFIASIWENRFEAMFELQNLRWINFGLRYKFRLK